MPYPLSATKLVTYRQCPQAYYFRHERGLKTPSAFGSTELGTALHRALAQAYGQWPYQEPLPPWQWFDACWNGSCDRLTPTQVEEGRLLLHQYYQSFVVAEALMQKPLGIEGKITATVQFDNIEFSLNGRYDRLDWLGDGLELIDYKTSKRATVPDAIDVQLGLYYLALEQIYHQALRRLTLLFLRSGERLSFEVTQEHQKQVRSLIADLAMRLRADDQWVPNPGKHCDRCTYQKYCTAKTCTPEPLPQDAKPPRQVQLVLSV